MHWWHSYQISEKQTLKWFQVACCYYQSSSWDQEPHFKPEFWKEEGETDFLSLSRIWSRILEMLITLQYSAQSYGKITIVIYRKWDHLHIFWDRGKNFPRQHLFALLHPWGRSSKHFDELYTQYCWWCLRKATEAKSNIVNLEVQVLGWKFPLQSLRVSWYLIYQVQVFCFHK